MTTKLKQILLKEAGLLSISQSDLDLFLIAQTNAITYQQLANTTLHGSTLASGRLSLKKLESDGYISGKIISGNERTKYYVLTAKGKKRIERIFGAAFLKNHEINLEKRLPASQQQLPHRIHTGDFYFSYLTNPYMEHLPVWKLEVPYQESKLPVAPPRCDGLFKTSYGTYFIEQDNCTQGEGAIINKLEQYMAADSFLGNKIYNNAIIFTLYAEAKERPVKKPPFSVYRILLKAIRVWRSLENELEDPLSFSAFCQQFEDNNSPCLLHLSKNDRCILKNLSYQYPDLTLNEVWQLKQTFLYDKSLDDERHIEQDVLFSKRLKQRFYPLLSEKKLTTLHFRLQKGMMLSVLPNHQLREYLPYALQNEYHFRDFLEKLLFHLGINDLSKWEYHPIFYYDNKDDHNYIFRNTFCSDTGILIVAEDIVHDLGGRERVNHYLKTHTDKKSILFLLFVSSREDAALFLLSVEDTLYQSNNSEISFCFLDKSHALFDDPSSHTAYFRKRTNENTLWLPAMLDYDDFLSELHLIERTL